MMPPRQAKDDAMEEEYSSIDSRRDWPSSVPAMVIGGLCFVGAAVAAFLIGAASDTGSNFVLAPLVIGLLVVLALAITNRRAGFLTGYIIAPFIICCCGVAILATFCGFSILLHR
jgi:hypothetical protein